MSSLQGYYNPIIIEESISNNHNHANDHQRDTRNQNGGNVNENLNAEANEERPPVIYIDMPNNEIRRQNLRLVARNPYDDSEIENHSVPKTRDAASLPPVIYIDMSNNENRRDDPHVVTNCQNAPPNQDGGHITVNVEDADVRSKDDELSTNVGQPNKNIKQIIHNEPRTPDYVEQTIFYDPFEDRRIHLSNGTGRNTLRPTRAAPLPPTNHRNPETSFQEPYQSKNNSEVQPANRPTDFAKAFNMPGQERQNGASPEYQRSQRADMAIDFQECHSSPPDFNTSRPTQLQISQRPNFTRLPSTPDDGFTLTPLPVTEYHELPPSYQEAITATQQEANSFNFTSNVVTQQPSAGFRANTVSAQDLLQRNGRQNSASPSRKVLKCQHCNVRVTTVVIRQNGCATHVIAAMFLVFCLFPVTILIYCGGCLKYENHYCPTCSNMIGYRVPMLGRQFAYLSPRHRS